MFLQDFFGGDNPADAANPYLDNIPGELQKYFGPYIDAGTRQIPGLENTYGSMVGDPGGFINGVGDKYRQSPGFKFALDQALQGQGHAAAAGGMAGSPQHEQQNMGIATGMANQDYNNWLQMALGQQNRGLSGQENMFNTGANMGRGIGEDMGNYWMQKGGLAFQGQANQNKSWQDFLKMMLSGAGMAAGGYLGGVPGAEAGAMLGGGMSGGR